MRKLRLLSTILVILPCLTLQFSCGAGRQRATSTVKVPPATYVFDCLDKSSFTMRFENDTAWLYLPMGVVEVPRVPAASGAKYVDGNTSIWRQGQTAFLKLGGKAYGKCINNPEAATWENARLNGVDFRAAGNNRDWYVEVTENQDIVFVSGRDKKRYEFPSSKPEKNEAASTITYRSKTGKHQLMVMIVGQECRDLSLGKWFASTVTVTLDGKRYQGCGERLQPR